MPILEGVPFGTELHEWEYAEGDLGIVYCLGREISAGHYDAVAAYHQVDEESATKVSLESGEYLRRFIYQGLPEEIGRLATLERTEIASKLVGSHAIGSVGLKIDFNSLQTLPSGYRSPSWWLNSDDQATEPFSEALALAIGYFDGIEGAELYGGASFGLIDKHLKPVEDVDLVFPVSALQKVKDSIRENQTQFEWSDIDPHGRLLRKRQLQKVKRWTTSQIRIANPYPMSIDIKVKRDLGDASLWDELKPDELTRPFDGLLEVENDTESLCTSPALTCRDIKDRRVAVLLDGYQYIGCAETGDKIRVTGTADREGKIVYVSQAGEHGIDPQLPVWLSTT